MIVEDLENKPIEFILPKEDGDHPVEYYDQKIKEEEVKIEQLSILFDKAIDIYIDVSSPSTFSSKLENFYHMQDMLIKAENFDKEYMFYNDNYITPKGFNELNYYIRTERLKDATGNIFKFLTNIVLSIIKRLSQAAMYAIRKIKKGLTGYSKKLLTQSENLKGISPEQVIKNLTDGDLDTLYEKYGKKGSKYKDIKIFVEGAGGNHMQIHSNLYTIINLDYPVTFLENVVKFFKGVNVDSVLLENTENLNKKIRETAKKRLNISNSGKEIKLGELTKEVVKKKGIMEEDMIGYMLSPKYFYYWRWTNESASHPPKGKLERIRLLDLIEEPEFDRQKSASIIFNLASNCLGVVKHLDRVESEIIGATNKIKNRTKQDVEDVKKSLKKYLSKDSKDTVKKNVKAYIQCYNAMALVATSKQMGVTMDNIYWCYNILAKMIDMAHALYAKGEAAASES